MAAACASCISNVRCNALACYPVRKTTLTSSLRGLSLKGVPALRIHSQKTQLVVAKASGHYLVKKVSGAELNKLLDVDRKKSVVVGFYATWCGPCIILAQELERLAVEFGHIVKFVKVDTDEEYELAHKMQVRGLPTVIFVSKDTQKNAIRTEGVLPREVFRSIIRNDL